MPYIDDISRFESLIKGALETEEIKKWLAETSLDQEQLRSVALESVNEIWDAAARQIGEYDIL